MPSPHVPEPHLAVAFPGGRSQHLTACRQPPAWRLRPPAAPLLCHTPTNTRSGPQFSASATPVPVPGTAGNAWGPSWPSQLGGGDCSWHLVCGVRGATGRTGQPGKGLPSSKCQHPGRDPAPAHGSLCPVPSRRSPACLPEQTPRAPDCRVRAEQATPASSPSGVPTALSVKPVPLVSCGPTDLGLLWVNAQWAALWGRQTVTSLFPSWRRGVPPEASTPIYGSEIQPAQRTKGFLVSLWQTQLLQN